MVTLDMQNIINSRLEVLALTIYALRIGGFSGSIDMYKCT